MGVQSQTTVHAFMDLDTAQNSYFIQQVGLAAASFGVSAADVQTVATTLNNTFGYRCAPAVTVIPSAGPVYDSICQNVTCPIAPNGNCGNGPAAVLPAVANKNMTSSAAAAGSSAMSSASGSAMMSGSASASKTPSASVTAGASATRASGTGVATYMPGTNAAVAAAPAGVLALVAGAFAFLL